MASNNKNKNNSKNKSKGKNKSNIILPIAAAVVVVAAAVTIIVPRLTKQTNAQQTTQNTSQVQQSEIQSFSGDIVIDEASLSETAAFYDYDANGITVEAFAVKASDGTARLALNTCQVCNGSPYAYFVQQGDDFICQNCKNVFKRDSIGTVHGGCNPVPLTEEDYRVEDGKIIIPAEILQQYAANFTNWKKF